MIYDPKARDLLVGQLLPLIPKEEASPALERYVLQYYQDAPLEDLRARTPVDLLGAVVQHRRLAQHRQAGLPNVAVYNPVFNVEGWQSTHTVVDIVNDDMPFLIDSVRMALDRLGLTVHFLVHPVLQVSRDHTGRLIEAGGPPDGLTEPESFIHLEVDRQTDAARLEAITTELKRVLGEVRVAVQDWPAMCNHLRDILDGLAETPPPVHQEELEETQALLDWVKAGNFTLFGYRRYDLCSECGEDRLSIVTGSGLGILREQPEAEPRQSNSFTRLPIEIRQLAHEKTLLTLTKANSQSSVHRAGYLDFIGVRRFDAAGRVIGEHRFLGLYTSSAYNTPPRSIPVLRKKIERVMNASGYIPNSHRAKALLNILETYPRDELFEIQDGDLTRIALGIVQLQERSRVRLFVRQDPFCRYVSCLVFVPRDAYNTEVRRKIETILLEELSGASIDFNVSITGSVLARIHFIVRMMPGVCPRFDAEQIEKRLATATRRWEDDFHQALLDHFGEEVGNEFSYRYAHAFPAAYREDFSPRAAVFDVEQIERLSSTRPLGMTLYTPAFCPDHHIHFKLYRLGSQVELSSGLPILENFGVRVLDEHPYRIQPLEAEPIWLSDFGLKLAPDTHLTTPDTRHAFEETFAAVFSGEAENDGLNQLVIRAGLSCRQVTLLRAYCRYLRQGTLNFSQHYIERCVSRHEDAVRLLIQLFEARLSPTTANPEQAHVHLTALKGYLESVVNIDEDRILQGFLTLILSTLRTNYFREENGQPRACLSFKFDPSQNPHLPEPRPLYEIFVYSARMEGVHLRGAKVARGGLRWSDRMEDYRTEVLGLVKAQQVKNAVIVPMGSKGGFVCKRLPPASDREAWLAEGTACYQLFIKGLLDLTDTRQGSQIIPPQDVVRHEGDDPYLVVAADKGTATFSDIANAISLDYGFWLGDAFASGGSAGYDHKKMGITARGAWKAVECHFHRLGLNPERDAFTVVGIGDMSGDVFGNGLLLSNTLKLVAAFDHRHIFLDPNPDPMRSFEERKRLFALPRSSWADYEAALLSEGGGIFSRTQKSIPLSPEVQVCLGCDAAALSPSELIQAILKAPVDLLYNGGIGTYVKAAHENHAEVRDRANDSVRINGRDLRARVVAEGGNLGFTQAARIEYAHAGGLINTDAIDNSAGVDCSDHEVNFKILLDGLVREGDLTPKQRNQLLASMEQDVAELVLQNNTLQTAALASGVAYAPSMLAVHSRVMLHLEKTGRLKRALEGLPDEETLTKRRLAHQGLTIPELAVLLAYEKIELKQSIIASSLPDDPALEPELKAYFPEALSQPFEAQLSQHPLKREIIANQLANRMLNRMGISFAFRLSEETRVSAAQLSYAWLTASALFRAPDHWVALDELRHTVVASVQIEAQYAFRKLLERATRWLIQPVQQTGYLALVERLSAGVQETLAHLSDLLPDRLFPNEAQEQARLEAAGLAESLALLCSRAERLLGLLDVVSLATDKALPVLAVGTLYYEVGEALGLAWLQDAVNDLKRENRWQGLARGALRDDVYAFHRGVVEHILARGEWGNWKASHQAEILNSQQMLSEIRHLGTPDLAMLSAALRELKNQFLV